jgi:iron-sulfur cluster assembly accessory protein
MVFMSEATLSPSRIQVTAAAVAELRQLLAQPEHAGKQFRIYVEQGGCSGMQYGMVFDERREGDQVTIQDDLTILVDGFSAKYLAGAQVDFSDSLTGGGFKITNPNARQSCGCGKSFQT